MKRKFKVSIEKCSRGHEEKNATVLAVDENAAIGSAVKKLYGASAFFWRDSGLANQGRFGQIMVPVRGENSCNSALTGRVVIGVEEIKVQYLIRRHGCNSANQSMTPVMPIGILEAGSREEAKELAQSDEPEWLACAEECPQVYNNQCLEAIPVSRAKRAELRSLQEADLMRSSAE